MRTELIDILSKSSNHSTSKSATAKQQSQTRKTRRVQQKARIKHKKKSRFVETFVLVAVDLPALRSYIYEQLL